MWAGGPPNPMQPIRPHSRAIDASGRGLSEEVSTDRVRRRSAGGVGRVRGPAVGLRRDPEGGGHAGPSSWRMDSNRSGTADHHIHRPRFSPGSGRPRPGSSCGGRPSVGCARAAPRGCSCRPRRLTATIESSRRRTGSLRAAKTWASSRGLRFAQDAVGQRRAAEGVDVGDVAWHSSSSPSCPVIDRYRYVPHTRIDHRQCTRRRRVPMCSSPSTSPTSTRPSPSTPRCSTPDRPSSGPATPTSPSTSRPSSWC